MTVHSIKDSTEDSKPIEPDQVVAPAPCRNVCFSSSLCVWLKSVRAGRRGCGCLCAEGEDGDCLKMGVSQGEVEVEGR